MTCESLAAVNLEGFLLVTQAVVKQMLAQNTGGSIVNISSTMAGHPFAGINATVPMITKGGLDAVTSEPGDGVCKTRHTCERGGSLVLLILP